MVKVGGEAKVHLRARTGDSWKETMGTKVLEKLRFHILITVMCFLFLHSSSMSEDAEGKPTV